MNDHLLPRVLIGAATGALALVLTAVPAGAHTTVFPTEAADGGYAKLDFRVPHGCESEPTEALRVQIPEGVTSVKPQVVAGWEIEVVNEQLDEPVEVDGEQITARISEIVWRGGPLSDGYLQEFGLSVKLPELGEGEIVYFPAIQECPGGAEAAWIEIPSDDGSGEELEFPAPAVVLAAAEGGHGGGGDAEPEADPVPKEIDAVTTSPVTEGAAASPADGTDPVAVAALVVAGLALAAGVGAIAMGRKRA